MFDILNQARKLRKRIDCLVDEHDWEQHELRRNRKKWATVKQQKPELARYMEQNRYHGLYQCDHCGHAKFYPNTTIEIKR